MYQIHQDIEAPLNIVSPLAVKKYQQFLQGEGEKSQEGIESLIRDKIKKKVQDNEVTESSLIDLVNETIQSNAISALEIYTNSDFVDEWVDIIFKDVDKDKLKSEWETKFSWDEFMRGFFDFFSRLRQPLPK